MTVNGSIHSFIQKGIEKRREIPSIHWILSLPPPSDTFVILLELEDKPGEERDEKEEDEDKRG